MDEKNIAGTTLNVLSLEDSVRDFEIIHEQLIDAGYHLNISRVDKEKEFESSIRGNRYDIILADFKLPGFDAFGALRLCNAICPEVPFICVSGSIGEETAIELIKLGAIDYVLKDRLARLPSAIKRALDGAKEKEAKLMAEEALQQKQDLLTQAEKMGKVGGWEFDIETKQQTWTETVYDIHELDITYQPTVDKGVNFYTPASRPIIEQAVQRSIEQGEPFDVELEIITAKGNLRSIHAIGKADLARRKISGFFQDITEQKRMEEALRESENKYKRLIENIPAIIFTIDLEGKITFVSQKIKEILGYENAETININILNFVPEEDRQRAIESLQKGMKGEKIKNFQIPMISKSGERLIFEFSFSRVYKDGVVVGAQGTAANITERKRAEDQLYENLAKLQLTIDEAPVCVAMVGTDKRFLQCNKSFYDFLGYSDEELKGKTIAEITFPDDIEIGMADLRAIVADEKKTSQVQKRYVRKDGRVVWGEVTISLIRDKNGNPLYFLPIIQDITARVQAEEAIRRAEKRSSALIENAPDGIVFVSTDGKFTYASPITYELFGYDTDQMIQLDPNILTHPDDLPKVLTVLSGVIQNPSLVTTLQYRFRHKDGRWLWIESTFSNLIAEPSIQAIVINFRDITERKRAEEALKQSQEQLKKAYQLSHIGAWNWVAETDTVTWTEELYRIAGFDPALPAPTYAEHPKIYTPKSFDLLKTAAEKAMSAGTKYELELELIRPDGTLRWTKANGGAKKDKHGKIIGLYGTLQDITEQKLAGEALRESEERFRKMFHRHDAIMLLIDADTGAILDANHSAELFYGYSIERLCQMNIQDINTMNAEEIAYQRTLAIEEKINDFIFSHRLANGEVKTVEVHSSPIDTKSGAILFSIIHDITEKKQAEELLRLKNIVFDTSIAANSIADIDGIITEANDSFLQIWGYQRNDEVVGNPISYFFNDPEEAVAIVNALNGKGEWEGDFTARKKDGSTFIAHTMATAIRDKNGKKTGYQSSVMDITERKKLESQREAALEEIRNLNETLEQRIKERTVELNETIDLLEETNRAFVGREMRMIELKEQIAELERK